MASGNNTRGFVPSQSAAPLAALDLASSLEPYRRALVLPARTGVLARVPPEEPAYATFDASGFLRDFEAVGGQVITNGQSFAVIYPSPDNVELIPLVPIEWGAVIQAAHDRAAYGPF